MVRRIGVYHTGGVTESSPTLDESGNLYPGGGDANISHKPRWKITVEKSTEILVDIPSAVAANGVIYFSSRQRTFSSVRQNDTETWRFKMKWNVNASPAIGNDGVVYVPNNLYLFEINSTNGLPPLAFVADVPRKSATHWARANFSLTIRVEQCERNGWSL